MRMIEWERERERKRQRHRDKLRVIWFLLDVYLLKSSISCKFKWYCHISSSLKGFLYAHKYLLRWKVCGAQYVCCTCWTVCACVHLRERENVANFYIELSENANQIRFALNWTCHCIGFEAWRLQLVTTTTKTTTMATTARVFDGGGCNKKTHTFLYKMDGKLRMCFCFFSATRQKRKPAAHSQPRSNRQIHGDGMQHTHTATAMAEAMTATATARGNGSESGNELMWEKWRKKQQKRTDDGNCNQHKLNKRTNERIERKKKLYNGMRKKMKFYLYEAPVVLTLYPMSVTLYYFRLKPTRPVAYFAS